MTVHQDIEPIAFTDIPMLRPKLTLKNNSFSILRHKLYHGVTHRTIFTTGVFLDIDYLTRRSRGAPVMAPENCIVPAENTLAYPTDPVKYYG